MVREKILSDIFKMKEMIQNLRIWFDNYKVLGNNTQELRKLKDHILTIKLESELLIDKINKKLILHQSLR